MPFYSLIFCLFQQSAFGEFNKAFSTMCQQKPHTLIGAEALPQTPVDVPLNNSFDFKSDVPRKVEGRLVLKQKEPGEICNSLMYMETDYTLLFVKDAVL